MRIVVAGLLTLVAFTGAVAREERCPYVIEGKVTDTHGNALEEAVAMLAGTQMSARSDRNGEYRLRVPCSIAANSLATTRMSLISAGC